VVVREEERGWCLGDWCTAEKVAIPEPFVNTYFLIKCLDYMTEIAEILQDKTDLWAKKSAEYRANLKRRFYDADAHTYCGGIQGADVFAVDIGLGDEKMLYAIAEKYDALGAFDTGIFGTDILIRILFTNGYGDLAMKLLTSEKENSFGAWLRRGETSLCEYWCGRASHNHHMFGAPLRYIFSHAFGVDDSGDMLKVRPTELSFALAMETEMETELGRVFVRREITAGGEIFTLRSDVPALFQYKSMTLTLKPNVETVLHF
jgi:alpha-L-rhamnosidase